jgi:hypothetical protein
MNDAISMTLRDYFAAEAMKLPLLTDSAWKATDMAATHRGEPMEQTVAAMAYEMADAMLKAREAKA